MFRLYFMVRFYVNVTNLRRQSHTSLSASRTSEKWHLCVILLQIRYCQSDIFSYYCLIFRNSSRGSSSTRRRLHQRLVSVGPGGRSPLSKDDGGGGLTLLGPIF